jgi:hypothetical protein
MYPKMALQGAYLLRSNVDLNRCLVQLPKAVIVDRLQVVEELPD